MDHGARLKLWRTARTLKRLRPGGKGARLPSVFFVTDALRAPDPVAVAMRLPRGTGVIYRGFGRPDAEATAAALSKVAQARGLVLLIGADPALARRVGALGVHLPERSMAQVKRVRALHPGWIVTVAAHSPMAIVRAQSAGADAALVSAVFASSSPSAGAPMGPTRLALLARRTTLALIALGGVNAHTAGQLVETGVAGFAAVGVFERS